MGWWGGWGGGVPPREPPSLTWSLTRSLSACLAARALVSYDHLDENTVRALGNTPRYFVPLGVKAWFTGLGLTNVVEGACAVWAGPVHTPHRP